MTTTRHLALAMVGLAALASVRAHAGTCGHAYLVEGQPPSAFAGITTGGSFSSYFWAWGAEAWDQGSWTAPLVTDGSGVAVNPGILWANSDACDGTVAGTGLLVEARTTASGGLFAVVAALGAEVDLDALQGGGAQSVAQPLPVPSVTSFVTGSDGDGAYADVGLAWSAPAASAWAVSDVGTVLVGYAVYAVTASGGGPVNTGDRSLFTRVGGTPTAPAPYITDDPDADGLLPATQTSCVVRVREGELYYFALSVILDGSGAPGGDPQADASAVETANVGACSAAVNADVTIFADGFEGGSTSAWSAAVP